MEQAELEEQDESTRLSNIAESVVLMDDASFYGATTTDPSVSFLEPLGEDTNQPQPEQQGEDEFIDVDE